MLRYSVQNDGEAVADAERKALNDKIRAILARDDLSLDFHGSILTRRDGTRGTLTRRAIDALFEL
jgi:hypothetical protein